METKEIIEKLNNFCESFFSKNVVEMDVSLFKEAAERLEELEAELEKRTINDRPYEWISVEEKVPEIGAKVLGVNRETGKVNSYTFFDHGVIKEAVSHWMFFPEPPKPKEPTFKDVFLGAFPKAAIENVIKINCIEFFFPQFNVDTVDCEKARCSTCWNQPYFEAEEEGESGE